MIKSSQPREVETFGSSELPRSDHDRRFSWPAAAAIIACASLLLWFAVFAVIRSLLA